MRIWRSPLRFLCTALYLTAHVYKEVLLTHACTFPDYLQSGDAEEETCGWHTRIRHDGRRESCYSIRHNVLEIRHSTSSLQTVRWKCALTYHGKFLLKRRDPQTLLHYGACVKFLRRSSSVVQMLWSRESEQLDPALCEDGNLALDPWLLVNYQLLSEDFTPSPVRGGFSMRITDSIMGENGCNYMHRPMKLESDCLAGEGVMFDFISENCLPTGVSMFVKQRTLPVVSWHHGSDHFIVLRRQDDMDLFCLRVPATGDSHLNAFLFTDLACLTVRAPPLLNVPWSGEVRYLVLHLQRYVYRHLCDDEYPQCSAVTCNSYIRHECHRSCEVCDASSPPATCSFPRRLRGQWYQTDTNGFNHVNITETDLSINNMGHFRCVEFPDSPSRRTRMYTTVSLFENGCRPRYTCVRLRRLGPSVLRYTLSRSYVWPSLEKDFGQAICSSNQFGTDPAPVNDLFRSQEDTGKPIVSRPPSSLQRVPCNLSSSYSITATFPNGSKCHGDLHEHCTDSTRLRLLFHAGCGQVLASGETFSASSSGSSSEAGQDLGDPLSASAPPEPWHADYSCLAHYEGHYWERVLLLQNDGDPEDTRCLLFTQLDASEALMMVSGQCDKNGWNFVRAGLRVPLLSLRLRPDEFPCKYLPATTTPAPTDPSAGLERLEPLPHGGVAGRHDSQKSYATSSPDQRLDPKHRISASYEEPKDEQGRPSIDFDRGSSPVGNELGAGGGASAARIGLAPLAGLLSLRAAWDWISR